MSADEKAARPLHGWLVIDKPLGPGSTRIVSAVKRALREGGYKRAKVGHGGTLDPLASGVLPIALGEATKLSGRMLDSDKSYIFQVRFGAQTDTLDLEGDVVATSEKRPELAEIQAILPLFTGPIDQQPPAFSAIKVDGRRAYALARAGDAVDLPIRAVQIHRIDLLSAEADRADFAVTVSKGTYIRSLARDIALALGTVGHVTLLRRTRAGPFTLEGAISLDKLTELANARDLEQALLPLTAGLDDIPALPVTPDQARALREGRILIGIAAKPGVHLATDQSVPVALVQADPEAGLRVLRGFNL